MIRRIACAVILGAALVLTAAPAWAHVTISPQSAPAGSDAVLTFNVPTESDTANTTQVEIDFPMDHPIASVDVQPKTGWTATVETVKVAKPIKTDNGDVTEAVSKVTWKGGKIEPGQFDQFVVSVGLPDDANSLEFKTLQTYDDGKIVRWIEDTPQGGPEPENPAPVLTLSKSSDSGSTAVTLPTNLAKKSDVDNAKTVSFVALGVGVLGLALGVVGLTRRRSSGR